MIHTDLGGHHFLGGVKVREISLQRLQHLIRTRYLFFRQSTPPLPTSRPQTCIKAFVGRKGRVIMEHDRTTGTVGGSFDSWRARAGSLGTPDLFAEHQRKLVRCSGCCETAGAGWKSWHQNKSFRGDRTIERGNIVCGINRRGPRLRSHVCDARSGRKARKKLGK
jgi:hypothetical protein